MPKISELEYVDNLQEGCCFPMVSNSETRKLSYGQLKERLADDIGSSANPELEGDEDQLESIRIGDTNYVIPSGGSGGTSNYNQLSNRPKINGHTLSGDQSASDLELFSGDYSDLTNKPTIPSVVGLASESWVSDNYVAQETGKGLSENDYTDADKAKVASALTEHQQLKTINSQSIVGSGNLVIQGGGTEVVANPTGTGSETLLTTIQIGDTIYRIPELAVAEEQEV